MDVEMLDQTENPSSINSMNLASIGRTSAAANTRPIIVLSVDDAHPFDLEAYISSYTGRTVVDRLAYITSVCPSLSQQALKLAQQQIHKLSDPSLYYLVINSYEQARNLPGVDLPRTEEVIEPDDKWVEETTTKNSAEKMKLEVELKTYMNNMIKESIRMAHRDLGDFHRRTGDHALAMKHYTKSREFCTTSQHVLEMCLSVLELLIEQRNYAHIPTYVFKADAALDSIQSSTQSSQPTASSSRKTSSDRAKIQTKLDFASALAHLGQGNYEKAAYGFLKLGRMEGLRGWLGKLVAPSDIAIYGTLCALAALSRSAIKANVLDNEDLGLYIEHEPYVRDLIEAYIANRYKAVLETVERYSTRHGIDIHLYSHVHDLTALIRSRSVVLYFQPFSTVKLDRMAQAFGWSVEETERVVVGLIRSGEIEGRVDSRDKILKARQVDPRAALFKNALKAGSEMQKANRKLLLRMRLQQAELVVKPPKHHRSSNIATDSSSLAGAMGGPSGSSGMIIDGFQSEMV